MGARRLCFFHRALVFVNLSHFDADTLPTQKKKEWPIATPFRVRFCLFHFDCFNGASVFASTAVHAFVIDYVDAFIAQNDCPNGTGICASAACDTFLRNYVCHIILPPIAFSWSLNLTICYYIILFSISKEEKRIF